MTRRILLDTGPLVAVLYRRDAYHALCVQFSRNIKAEFLTCWPVVTEAAWLLRMYPRGVQRLLQRVSAEAVSVAHLDHRAATWMANFVARYEQLGVQLADAALMYLADREGIDTVFTLDRRDFSIYKTSAGKSLHVVPEA